MIIMSLIILFNYILFSYFFSFSSTCALSMETKLERCFTLEVMELMSEGEHVDMMKGYLLEILEHSSTTFNVNQVVAILGGTKSILHDYLSSSDIELTTRQFMQIENLLTPKPSPRRKSLERINKSQKITYTFNRNDTTYHSWLDHNTACHIVKLIFNKYLMAISVSLVFALRIWRILAGDTSSHKFKRLYPLSYQICALVLYACTCIHSILLLLTINTEVLKRSLRHFVFWLKTMTCIWSQILWWYLRFTLLRTKQKLLLAGEIFSGIEFICVTIMYCSIDGYQMPRKIKIILGIATSLVYTHSVFAALSFAVDHDHESIVEVGSLFCFSVASLYASSVRVLCIFLWRQTIMMIKKKGKCINIKHSPHIAWTST